MSTKITTNLMSPKPTAVNGKDIPFGYFVGIRESDPEKKMRLFLKHPNWEKIGNSFIYDDMQKAIATNSNFDKIPAYIISMETYDSNGTTLESYAVWEDSYNSFGLVDRYRPVSKLTFDVE